eukprot:6661529-Pyramimonas_sp.AAC.1
MATRPEICSEHLELERLVPEHGAGRQRMASETMLLESCQKTSAPAWRAGSESMDFCQEFNHQQF